VIRLGKQQISNGAYISNEYLEKEEDQWLMEKRSNPEDALS
jgi:hypothetical protein